MTPRRLYHRIERTRNKHSRAVCKGNTIIIRLARNLSAREEREHIESLLKRMTHLAMREMDKETVDPFGDLLQGFGSQRISLANGKSMRVTLRPHTRTRAVRTEEGWDISVSPHIRRAQLHRFLWSLVSESEAEHIRALVHQINEERFGVPVRGVKLRFATTQWGSCSPRGIIMLNTALLFLPPRLLLYVIVHELAHRKHPNHSAAYWNEVERALPGYGKLYDELHQYRLPQL